MEGGKVEAATQPRYTYGALRSVEQLNILPSNYFEAVYRYGNIGCGSLAGLMVCDF